GGGGTTGGPDNAGSGGDLFDELFGPGGPLEDLAPLFGDGGPLEGADGLFRDGGPISDLRGQLDELLADAGVGSLDDLFGDGGIDLQFPDFGDGGIDLSGLPGAGQLGGAFGGLAGTG